jgi:hypothetical protein
MVATISGFLEELAIMDSPWRVRWLADTSVHARVKVVQDYGLPAPKVQIIKKALETGDIEPVREACRREQHEPTIVYLWVK